MMQLYIRPDYEVVRNEARCIACRVCERQCANEVHSFDPETGLMRADESKCVNCHRCVSLCPTHALKIVKTDDTYRENANWEAQTIHEVYRQANTGGVLLSSMGNPKPYPVFWDKLLINASQVTNPPIDPLREPMGDAALFGQAHREGGTGGKRALKRQPSAAIKALRSHPLFGDELRLHLLQRAREPCAGGGSARHLLQHGRGRTAKYGKHTIVQVASGRFGVHKEYLETAAAIEIKMGQGAKPGIGGHLPGGKISEDVSKTRMIPQGVDAISPAPHHDIYSIEDLKQLVDSLKEATEYKKPIIVKIAAVHNAAAIASGIARSGADIIAIDGFRGGTGAAPTRIRDNVGIPIEMALAQIDTRLREEGIRDNVSILVGGSVRSSADVVKAIALIATQRPDLVKRLNPDLGYERLVNLVSAWKHEIEEMMGGMGINSLEALRGNRLMLRGIGLTDTELRLLGVRYAGDSL